MSLLRRLEEQAQQLRATEASQKQSVEDRRLRYQQTVVPAMQALGVYLLDLSNTLKVVRPALVHNFELPGYGKFDAVPQFDYTHRADVRINDFEIEFGWRSRVDSKTAPKLELSNVDPIRIITELFKRHHLGGIKEERRSVSGHIMQASIQATGLITSSLNVKANADDEQIRFVFDNVDRLGPSRQALASNLLSEEVFERLGEFLLRENDLFIREQWVRSLVPVTTNWAAPVAEDPIKRPEVEMLVEAPPPPPPKPAQEQIEARDRELQLMAEFSQAALMADAAVERLVTNAPDARGERDFSKALSPGFEIDLSAFDKPFVAPPESAPVARAEQAAVAVPAPASPSPVVPPIAEVEPTEPAVLAPTAAAVPPSAPSPAAEPRAQGFLARFQKLRSSLE